MFSSPTHQTSWTTYVPASVLQAIVSYSDLFEQVRTTPLLVLDGLGSQSATPWAEEKLRQIINYRYNAELPTIVTTAVPLSGLDPYIATRLTTRGLGRIVELGLTQSERLEELGRIPENMLNTMTFERFNTNLNGLTSEQRKSLEGAYQAARNFAERPGRLARLDRADAPA